MKRIAFAFAAGLLALAPAPRAEAAVTAKVSLAQQRMDVHVDGVLAHSWPVSTGAKDFETPAGAYTPTWLDKDHHSQKYDDAPMPYAVFFRGGYAVHGTTSVGMLGRRASHGCVRLSTANARQFYELVQQHGLASSKVVIIDSARLRSERTTVADHTGSQNRERAAAARARQGTANSRYSVTPDYAGQSPAAPVLYYQVDSAGRMIPVLQPLYRRY